jgi:hypothetical protein
MWPLICVYATGKCGLSSLNYELYNLSSFLLGPNNILRAVDRFSVNMFQGLYAV